MEFDIKNIFDSLNIIAIEIDNQNIVYIKNNDNIYTKIRKYIIINIDRKKKLIFYKFNENIVSHSKRLFQIINFFFQFIDFIRIFFRFKFNKLLYINYLFYRIVQKNSFHVYLFEISIQNDNENEQNFVIYKFNNRNENFIII